MTEINYNLDTSIISAKHELITREFSNSDIYSVSIDCLFKATADDVFNFFVDTYDLHYRIEFGKYALLFNHKFTVRFDGSFGLETTNPNAPRKFEEEITIAGDKKIVQTVVAEFIEKMKPFKINRNHNVEWVSMGSNGLETVTIPIKSHQKMVPEMYPFIPNMHNFITDFMESSANVLILTGPPGLGKSALINHIIMESEKRAQVVYDPAVMKFDQLYSSFIQRCFRDEGGIMIMEDADVILTSREFSGNETMSKLLNVSDGILNTSSAKFIFTANINKVSDIDEALTRPGRCYDIINFRHLTRSEAEIAANAIGKELIGDKKEYTVAEIFNQKLEGNKLQKIGF